MLRSITLVTSLALVMSACSTQQDDDPLANTTEWPTSGPTEFDTSKIVPDGTKSAHSNVVKDIKNETMPTDAFVSRDLKSTDEAISNIITKECGARNGIDTSAVTISFNPNQAPEPYINPVTGYQIFNVESAKVMGYGIMNDMEENGSDTIDEALQRVTEEGFDNDDFHQCMSDAYRSKDGLLAEAGIDLGGANSKEGGESNIKKYMVDSPSIIPEVLAPVDVPSVKEATVRWKECMAPAGIADLPDSPYYMPSESIYNELYEDDSEGTNQEVLKQKEIAIATMDAQCRESSGFARAFYDAQWVLVDEYVGKNLSELQGTYRKDQETATELIDFIKEHQ